MSSLVKPLLFFIFIMCFLFFLNLVCIFISINKLDMVLNHVDYIVTSNGENIENAKSEVDKYLSTQSTTYEVKYDYEYDKEFLNSTLITMNTRYRYIGSKRSIELSKQILVMSTQM